MEESWNVFLESGKINDYLRVCEEREKREAEHDGSEPHSDRNGLKCNADWRV